MPWSEWQERPVSEELRSRAIQPFSSITVGSESVVPAGDNLEFSDATYEAAWQEAVANTASGGAYHGIGTIGGTGWDGSTSGWETVWNFDGNNQNYSAQIAAGVVGEEWRGLVDFQFDGSRGYTLQEPWAFFESEVYLEGTENVDWGYVYDPTIDDLITSQWENSVDVAPVAGSGRVLGRVRPFLKEPDAGTTVTIQFAVRNHPGWDANPQASSLTWADWGATVSGGVIGHLQVSSSGITSPDLTLSTLSGSTLQWEQAFPVADFLADTNMSLAVRGVPTSVYDRTPGHISVSRPPPAYFPGHGVYAEWAIRMYVNIRWPRWRYWIPGGRPPLRQQQRASGARWRPPLRQRQHGLAVARKRGGRNS